MSKSNPEPGPECPLCGGLGWVRRDVPVGDPDFGKLSPCSCLVPELERQQLERLQSVSGLGPAFQDKGFQNFVEIHRNSSPNRRPISNRAALRAARAFAQEPQGWLIIGGGNGTGKTHLAAAIANDRLARGEAALFVVVPELLDHLRSTYAPQSPVSYDRRFGQICTTPLLILDDLGAQQSTEWAWEKLYQILVRRRSQELPLVVTTNLDIPSTDPSAGSGYHSGRRGAGSRQKGSNKRQPPSLDRRIASRLAEVGWVSRVLITASDWRRRPGGGKGGR